MPKLPNSGGGKLVDLSASRRSVPSQRTLLELSLLLARHFLMVPIDLALLLDATTLMFFSKVLQIIVIN